MKDRIAIVDGIRTPFCKAGGRFAGLEADDLGAIVVRELMDRAHVEPEELDELIMGNVAQPVDATNVARVIALKADLPTNLTAHSVHRNCASGMQSITSAANMVAADQADIVLVGGAESMSNIPLIYSKPMTKLFMKLFKARTTKAKLKALLSFHLSYLKPIIGIERGLTDQICGLNMGDTAEILSREFHTSREEQDEYALTSHQKASAAMKAGRLADEIVPVPLPPEYKRIQDHDDGPRHEQSMAALGKLKPYFERKTGTVTVGNACPVTDGAAATLVMRESTAKKKHLEPLGYLLNYSYAALEGHRMGLGPVYSTAKVLKKTDMKLSDFDLVEINEAFAAQVLACLKAFKSDEFSKQYLDQEKAIGTLPIEKLNVNGGAIALGHPVGATGTRMVITLLRELRRREQHMGLATLCVGGGQGAALVLEVD